MYYEIVEEYYAEHKAELIQRAKDGKTSQRKNYKWNSEQRKFVQVGETEIVSAQEILDDFLEYEKRGYM